MVLEVDRSTLELDPRSLAAPGGSAVGKRSADRVDREAQPFCDESKDVDDAVLILGLERKVVFGVEPGNGHDGRRTLGETGSQLTGPHLDLWGCRVLERRLPPSSEGFRSRFGPGPPGSYRGLMYQSPSKISFARVSTSFHPGRASGELRAHSYHSSSLLLAHRPVGRNQTSATTTSSRL